MPRVREPGEEDLPRLVAFLDRALEHRMSLEDWQWEYGRFGKEAVFVVIEDEGGDFLGSQGFIPVTLVHRGRPLVTGKSENTFVHPSLRGTGMFERLYSEGVQLAAARGHHVLWGFTALSKVWRDKLGFLVEEHAVHEASLVIGLGTTSSAADPGRLARALISSMRCLWSRGLLAIRGFAAARRAANLRFASEPDLPGDLNLLFERLCAGHPDSIRLNYSEEYMRWRTKEIPASRYDRVFAYRQTHLAAFAIVNRSRADRPYLSDFAFVDSAAGESLLRELVRRLVGDGAERLGYFGNLANPINAAVFKLLGSVGATIRANRAMNFVVKANGVEEFDPFAKIENWVLSGLYTEGYRL